MNMNEVLANAAQNPALRSVLTTALHGISDDTDAMSGSMCIGGKEYIDCGSWTWQG